MGRAAAAGPARSATTRMLRQSGAPACLGAALALSIGLAGCAAGAHVSDAGNAGQRHAGAPWAELRAAPASGVGTVIVDGDGMTLYLFVPDHQGKPTCTGLCLAEWPPLILPAGSPLPTAGHGVRGALIGSVSLADGARQVTYGGWPLYRWVTDTAPGQANGEALSNFGGPWFAVSTDGSAVRAHTGF